MPPCDALLTQTAGAYRGGLPFIFLEILGPNGAHAVMKSLPPYARIG